MGMIRYAALYRVIWFMGRMGGGKTSGALWLADRLCREGLADYVVTNISLTFPCVEVLPPFNEVGYRLRNCVVVLDEAWRDIPKGSQQDRVDKFQAYLRKRGVYIILASVQEVSNKLSPLVLYREWNGLPFAVPLWRYRWVQKIGGYQGKKSVDTGHFDLLWPATVFKWYDHREIPGDNLNVYDWRLASKSALHSTASFGSWFRRLWWVSSGDDVHGQESIADGRGASDVGSKVSRSYISTDVDADADAGSDFNAGADTDRAGYSADVGRRRHSHSCADPDCDGYTHADVHAGGDTDGAGGVCPDHS